jgi:DNA repair protein RecO (recombination protein O)
MQIKTRGIVLHTIKYSETSVIVKIYTEKLGLVSYIVKGVRSAKSKSKAALLQPLTLLEMEVTHRENKQLQFIKEFSRAYNYQSLPFDTLKSAVALFLLELITRSVREHEQNEEMFEFIYEAFCMLDQSGKFNPDFHLIFMVRFSGYIGFMPQRNFTQEYCYFDLAEGSFKTIKDGHDILDVQESRILYDLITTNLFAATVNLQLTRAARKKMMQSLLKYYSLHIENFSLKSPEILEAILY